MTKIGIMILKTCDGRAVEIVNEHKSGLSVFVVFGYIDDEPCHWTRDGRYRMDGKADPRDIKDW